MTNKLRKVNFRVQCKTSLGESVCVVGNCDQLGQWKHEQAFVLQKVSEYDATTTESPEVWAGTAILPAGIDILFRYFVCMQLDNPSSHGKLTVMRRWETNLHPRKLKRLSNEKEKECDDNPSTDIFGVYGDTDDHETVDHGWLTSETVIQFKITSDPIQFWRKKFKNVSIRLKMVGVNLNRQNSVSDFNDSMDYQDSSSGTDVINVGWPIIEVAVINNTDYQLSLQEQFGKIHKPDEMMIFQAQVLQMHTVAYMIDFYADNNSEIPKHIGFCHILPSNLRETIGSMIVPITSLRQEPIGQMNVEYLVVKPLPNCDCDMTVSYSRYWKHHWTGLDIGHRGSGNSVRPLKSCTNIRENTIASLQKAAEHGADFVEFDVQLSKDFIPVLFHDFHVNIGIQQKAKKGGEMTTLKIPVKDLTLKQLHELKVCHAEDPHIEDEEDDTHDPFPTLQHALEVLPTHVGFNVEVKWTMETKDGGWELENPFELNMYIDVVLQAVLKYGGERRVVFSCFHPDICTMIRLKQNKYPVLFLTQGITAKYPEYKDLRTKNISVAVYYALHAGILGLNVHTEDILRDPSQIKEIIEHGLIAFCWGDDNNDVSTIRYLKDLGLHGVIYDRINDHLTNTLPEKKSIFFTEHQYELLQVAATSPEAEIQDSNPFQAESDSDTPLDSPNNGQSPNNNREPFDIEPINGTNGILNSLESAAV